MINSSASTCNRTLRPQAAHPVLLRRQARPRIVVTPVAAAVRETAESVSAGLPIQECIHDVLDGLQRSNCLVLQAPPGAGKTTTVPLALMLSSPSYLQPSQRILVLEPRRLAAKSAARRMAALLGEAPGGRVGYRVRFEKRVGANTRVEVVTEGVLLRRLQGDPGLEGVGAVLLDEFHERGIDADTSLALLLDVQQYLRPDLRLLVMSATLGGGLAPRLQELMQAAQPEGAEQVPLVVSEGRCFPVRTIYLGRPLPRRDGLERATADAVLAALAHPAAAGGDVLAFLPGVTEIGRTRALLSRELASGVAVLPLHGNLAPAAQDAAVRRGGGGGGGRRVVLATPIAESSLTIEGVTAVVDAGLRRSPVYDVGSGVSRLVTRRVSGAAAEQRRGRAGRTAPGVCFRLWDEGDPLDEATPPEVCDADLAPLALQLAAWGCADGTGLAWLDAPDPDRLADARQLLEELGAVEGGERGGAVTEQGKRMAALGVHPRFAHLVLCAADLACPELGALLASMLSERDVLRAGGGGGGGGGGGTAAAAAAGQAGASADIALRLAALAGVDGTDAVGAAAADVDLAGTVRVLEGARQMMRQLRSFRQAATSGGGAEEAADSSLDAEEEAGGAEGSLLEQDDVEDGSASKVASEAAGPSLGPQTLDRAAAVPGGGSAGEESAVTFANAWQQQCRRPGLVGALVALAYPDRIAQRKGSGLSSAYTLSTGLPVKLLSSRDPLQDSEFLAIADLGSGRAGANDVVRLAAALSRRAIDTYLKQEIREREVVFWAAGSSSVLGRRQMRLGSLLLSEAPLAVTDERAVPVLIQALRLAGFPSLPLPPAAEALRQRAEWLRIVELGGGGSSAIPDMSERGLMASLEEWLAPHLEGCRSRAHLQRLNWHSILSARLGWRQLAHIEANAPQQLALPTGSRTAIDYSRSGQPVARARIQEVFGLLATPRLAAGRVPLALELVSPAGRPLQVTSDLAGFWASSYKAVRAEMKGRYTKHYWPEDPSVAEPTRTTKKGMEKAAAAAAVATGGGGGGGGGGAGGDSKASTRGKPKRR